MSQRKCPFCGHPLGRVPFYRFLMAMLGYDWCPNCGFRFWGYFTGIPEDELSLKEFKQAVAKYLGTNEAALKKILSSNGDETKKARKP